MTSKRRPFLAAFLSLAMPGLGHVYAGDPKKGLSLVVIEYSVLIFAGLLGVLSTFYGIASIIILILIFYVYVVVSAVRLALKNSDYQLQSFNRWYWYVTIFLAGTVFVNLLISFRGAVLGYETYRIPASSMEPTLQVGDFITVNTRYAQPEVGDVIVFRYPNNRKLSYVKRIAALGGDTVAIVNGMVTRNGIVEEKLGVSEMKRSSQKSQTMRNIQVPENQYFVLGDWRDNSNDSRYWGFVSAEDIIGVVTYIWLSKDFDRIGKAVQ